MQFTGKQKAAILLTQLDSKTATELLKGLPVEDVQEIGLELARIDASGHRNFEDEKKVMKEFCVSLAKGLAPAMSIKGFLGDMLSNILGPEKAQEIQNQIRKATVKRDPFVEIRSAPIGELVMALEGEHPQTIAVVLSELSPKKSQEVLAHLSDESRIKAVCKMTTLEQLRGEVRQRIASLVTNRLKDFKGEMLPEGREQVLRKLAIMLSGLEKEFRDQLLDQIATKDEETSSTVRKLMITWEDIGSISDRSLQDALRNIDAKKLATALYGADEEITEKIKANISARAVETLNEEIGLMQEPLPDEIHEAREEVVGPLREANEEGKLRLAGR